MKKLKRRWEHSACYITNTEENKKILEVLKGQIEKFEFNFDEQDGYAVYSNEKSNRGILFLESEFIGQQTRFNDICDKLSKKNFQSTLMLLESEKIEDGFVLFDAVSEFLIYTDVIKDNIIDGSLQKSKLAVSIKMFQYLDSDDKIKFVQDLYIMFFLSNKSKFKDNKFEFEISNEENFFFNKFDFSSVESLNLYSIYEWIVDCQEYPKAYKVKLKIIRELLIRNRTLDDNERTLKQASIIFERIIANKTKDYFEQVNKLKDDFLIVSESISKSYKTVNAQMFGWLSSIGILIYRQMIDLNDYNYIWRRLFFSNSERIQIVLMMLLLGWLVIMIFFYGNIHQNKVEYNRLKEFYTKDLYFTDELFTEHIKEPKIELAYKIIFIILLTLLCIRLAIAFYC